jgi:hypothetical protein
MLKKKSLIFALIGVVMFAVAMYFTYRETRDNYDLGDFDDQPEEQEPEPEQEPERVARGIKTKPTPEPEPEPVSEAATDENED